MNTPPVSSVRWGTVIVGMVLVLVLLFAWFIKYPYIIPGNAVITTKNPPAAITARVTGPIEHLMVKDGNMVSNGKILGVMESTANYKNVQWLDSLLYSINVSRPGDDTISLFTDLPDDIVLGEMQDQYSDLRKSYQDYLNFERIDSYGKKREALLNEIISIEEYINHLSEKEFLTKDKLKVEEQKFLRDSLLNSKEILPDADLENSRQKYYSLKIELVQVQLDAASRQIDLASKRRELQSIISEEEQERQRYLSEIAEKLLKLKARIEWWKQTFLLISPVDGKVTFTGYWSENQTVTEGEVVMTVVPEEETEIIARITIPMRGSGKVQEGQTVNISLEGYPYLEYGMIKGIIRSRSQVPQGENYILDVALPDGLSTFYGKKLEFTHNMSGRAEIISEDMRLIERLIYPFKYLINKNRNRPLGE